MLESKLDQTNNVGSEDQTDQSEEMTESND